MHPAQVAAVYRVLVRPVVNQMLKKKRPKCLPGWHFGWHRTLINIPETETEIGPGGGHVLTTCIIVCSRHPLHVITIHTRRVHCDLNEMDETCVAVAVCVHTVTRV
jgi:hypothetical protein